MTTRNRPIDSSKSGIPFAPQTQFTTRPIIMGTKGVVTSGHYLASVAGFRIFEQGGNAIDAAAAMCFCLNLLEPQSNGIGGEAPTLIYSAKEKKTYAISGMGWSPKALTIDWCREKKIDMIPGDGYLPACVPATVDTWAAAVARFGTMSFSQILQPAIELAESGFPIYEAFHKSLQQHQDKFNNLYPTTSQVYLPDGLVPNLGTIFRNPDFANMLRIMCRAEDQGKAKGRVQGIEAASNAFYKGEIVESILNFISSHPIEDATGAAHSGLLSYDDFAEWNASVEDPVSFDYRGLEVHKCSTWTQGPVFLQQLSILKEYDIKNQGHNSIEYLHTWIESAKLAFADREAYYGDPVFDQVPLNVLLSPGYAEQRRQLIGDKASMEMRPGDIGFGIPDYDTLNVANDNTRALGIQRSKFKDVDISDVHEGDTTHLDAVDAQGNMVSSTPSGGWIGTSPVIPGLGFPIGTRGQMFYLNPDRPNSLAPRKRPRATLTPSLVTRNGDPLLVFGTPGGDSQEQITQQFFLNYVEFGMNLQEALDAPTVRSQHFPSSFYPRDAHPGRVVAESRIDPAVIKALERKGHDMALVGKWHGGKSLAIHYNVETGVISGAASAKGNIGYAIGR